MEPPSAAMMNGGHLGNIFLSNLFQLNSNKIAKFISIHIITDLHDFKIFKY